MTQAEFLAWEPPDDRRSEFDGFAAVAVNWGTNNHNLICQNLWGALRSRLRGTPCRCLGPDAGVETAGAAVRYPDALVTCMPVREDAKLIQGAVVISKVSARSDRIDHVEKYVIIARYRRSDATSCSSSAEIGVEIPGAEIYEDIEFPKDGRWRPGSED